MLRRISKALSFHGSHDRARREGYSPSHFKKDKTIKYLQVAIEKQDVPHIKEIVSKVDVVQLEEGKLSFVRMACETGNLDSVAVLLNEGASVNLIGNYDYAPIHIAAKTCDKKLLHLLLSHNANINALTKYEKRTPLHLALCKGNLKVIEFLIRKGANINHGDIYKSRPIHIACRRGQDKALQLLLNQHVEVDAYDNEGWTGLHYAAKEGNKEVMKLLLSYNANIDAQSKYGRTPLHWACISGHLNIIHTLLKSGTNVNIKDVHGNLAQVYVGNDSAKKMMKQHKGSIPYSSECEALSDSSRTSSKLVSRQASEVVGAKICDTAEDGEGLSECFDNLLITTKDSFTYIDSSIEGMEALLNLTLEGSIEFNSETVKDFNAKFEEISTQMKSLRLKFSSESNKFQDLLNDCKRASNPRYIALIQLLIQCIVNHVSQFDNGWQIFLKHLPLPEDVCEILTFQLRMKPIPDHDKVNQSIMHWARSCDNERILYMCTLLQTLAKCEMGQPDQEHVDEVLVNFLNLETNFKTGTSENRQSKISGLVHSLTEKDIRQICSEMKKVTEDINIFPNLDRLQLTENTLHDGVQQTKGSDLACDLKLEQLLCESIEEEDVCKLTAAIKCIIMSGYEELITCIL